MQKVNKLIVYLVLTLGIVYTTNAQDKKNDWTAEDLKGKVKKMTIRGFRAEPGPNSSAIKGRLVHTTVKTYTESGYLLESISSIGGSSVGKGPELPFRSAKIVYKYDKYNTLVGSCSYNTQGQLEDSSIHEVDERGNRIIWKIFKGNKVQEWEYISEYDNTGNLLETNDYHWGQLITRHTYRYNDHNKVTMESDHGPDGRLQGRRVMKYDENWNKIEMTEFDGSGNFVSKHTYFYNDYNWVIEEREYLTDGVEKYTRIVTDYDNLGNVSELHQYDENGKLIYYGKFDKFKNHLADITYAPDGRIREKITAQYKYDSYGNELEELLQLSEKSPVIKSIYKYEYDVEGNWIRKTVFEDGEAVRIAERDLEYF